MCTRWNFELIVCLRKLGTLKQKVVVDMFLISDLGGNLVRFWPSACARFMSFNDVSLAILRNFKVILKVLWLLNDSIRGMPIRNFWRRFNFLIFRLLMQFCLNDRRMSSLSMLMSYLILAFSCVLEF